MKAKAETTLIGLLSSALSGYTPSSLPEADYQALYRLAKHHAVANIVAYAMQKNHIKIPPESRALFNRALIAGVYMEANQSAESAAMSQALDDAQIRHIFLKGSVLRKYYPSPDMRTSCDMDVLVDRENIDAACQVMKNRGYRFVEEGEKDILFVKAPNIHVELHKTLAEEEYAGKELFDSILDSSLPDGQRMYARVMTDEDFYVYMIFHVAKHFINGGSGIRSVLDIWIYRKNKPALNESVIREKLRVLKLETFERELVSLSKVWMEGAQGTALSNALSDFVIGAGTFGTQENRVGVQLGKDSRKARCAYMFSRAFPPWRKMKYRYPILKKIPVLLPFCWAWRFMDIFSKKRKQRIASEIQLGHTMSKDKIEQITALYRQLELHTINENTKG